MTDVARLTDVATWYRGMPHQQDALEYLQGQIPLEALVEFSDRWRSQGPPPVQPPGVTPQVNRPSLIEIPGQKVDLNAPIIPGGNFTWAEALHQGNRIPRTKAEVSNIVALATALQPWRIAVGQPVRVLSWYRPEPFNAQAGGAQNSQHLGGRAADLRVGNRLGRDLAAIADRLGW
nr:hypothetical protein [Kaiparowitsia implicata GSE-PSE-MK54-09C]